MNIFTVLKLAAVVSVLSWSAFVSAEEKAAVKVEHGEYQDWRLLSVSHRNDKKTLRAILGNDTAIVAARKGETKPWPDGTVLAKVVWNESTHPNWPDAVVPGSFAKAEAMLKDSKKYAGTNGWWFGFWENKKLVVYEEAKAKECLACHTAVKDNDYVFTRPAMQ